MLVHLSTCANYLKDRTMKFASLCVAMMFLTVVASARVVTVTNSGFTFSPATITVTAGDTVRFSLGSSHNAVEVSKDEFDSNGDRSNGGFSTGFGGGTVVMRSPGTFYYVCTPHASFGMKGQIVVQPGNTTETPALPSSSSLQLRLDQNSPNPVRGGSEAIIRFRGTNAGAATLVVYDLLGNRKAMVYSGWMNAETTYSATVPTQSLAPGRYLYRLQQGSETVVRMMTVVR